MSPAQTRVGAGFNVQILWLVGKVYQTEPYPLDLCGG
jgi:hypothetical protein